MVPVLGADVVIGGQRKQIFTDTIKRDVRSFFSYKAKLKLIFDDRMLHFQKRRKLFPRPILRCPHHHLFKNCQNLVQ